jgi:glycosyltransferase involved in cell wall biosynthesis
MRHPEKILPQSMQILYLNHYAGSPRHGMEYRPYYLSREWVRAGHTVRMLAASYSHVRARQPSSPDGGPLTRRTRETIDGIEYDWYPTPAYNGNGLGRVKNIWSFLRQVWRDTAGLLAEFRPDVVIASSTYPMDIWVARRFARRTGAKLVFEVHDLWPLSPIEIGGMSPGHPFIRLCQAAEDVAYRDADIVVSMLPKVSDHMASHGLDLRKLCIVPNGIAPEEWEGEPQALEPSVAQFIAEQRKAGRCVVGYAGSHGTPNALEVLLEAAGRLKAAPLAFVFVGDGHEKPALQQRLAEDDLPQVAMFPPIPKGQIPSFLSAIDIAYIGWQRMPIYRFGIAPNKLMDYMMAGCAVLHSVEAGNDPVAESGCGLTVPPADAAAVAEGLLRLAALSPGERTAMGEKGRAFIRHHHIYPVLAERFLAAVRNVYQN